MISSGSVSKTSISTRPAALRVSRAGGSSGTMPCDAGNTAKASRRHNDSTQLRRRAEKPDTRTAALPRMPCLRKRERHSENNERQRLGRETLTSPGSLNHGSISLTPYFFVDSGQTLANTVNTRVCEQQARPVATVGSHFMSTRADMISANHRESERYARRERLIFRAGKVACIENSQLMTGRGTRANKENVRTATTVGPQGNLHLPFLKTVGEPSTGALSELTSTEAMTKRQLAVIATVQTLRPSATERLPTSSSTGTARDALSVFPPSSRAISRAADVDSLLTLSSPTSANSGSALRRGSFRRAAHGNGPSSFISPPPSVALVRLPQLEVSSSLQSEELQCSMTGVWADVESDVDSCRNESRTAVRSRRQTVIERPKKSSGVRRRTRSDGMRPLATSVGERTDLSQESPVSPVSPVDPLPPLPAINLKARWTRQHRPFAAQESSRCIGRGGFTTDSNSSAPDTDFRPIDRVKKPQAKRNVHPRLAEKMPRAAAACAEEVAINDVRSFEAHKHLEGDIAASSKHFQSAARPPSPQCPKKDGSSSTQHQEEVKCGASTSLCAQRTLQRLCREDGKGQTTLAKQQTASRFQSTRKRRNSNAGPTYTQIAFVRKKVPFTGKDRHCDAQRIVCAEDSPDDGIASCNESDISLFGDEESDRSPSRAQTGAATGKTSRQAQRALVPLCRLSTQKSSGQDTKGETLDSLSSDLSLDSELESCDVEVETTFPAEEEKRIQKFKVRPRLLTYSRLKRRRLRHGWSEGSATPGSAYCSRNDWSSAADDSNGQDSDNDRDTAAVHFRPTQS